MTHKSEYVQKIEDRVYEQLLRLRYQTELAGMTFAGLNLEFALRTCNRGLDVDLLAETDMEALFLSLIKNLIKLVCLEEGSDANLVLLDVFAAYLDYIDKSDRIR